MSDFGRELTRLTDERGTGVRQLARAVYVNAAHISNLRNGKTRPSGKLAALIDEHLQAAGALRKAAARDHAARAVKPGRHAAEDVTDVLARVEHLSRAVDPEVIRHLQDSVAHVISQYERLDHASLALSW